MGLLAYAFSEGEIIRIGKVGQGMYVFEVLEVQEEFERLRIKMIDGPRSMERKYISPVELMSEDVEVRLLGYRNVQTGEIVGKVVQGPLTAPVVAP